MKRMFNLETLKIELHFEKSEYQAMSKENKKELKSGYLWSNYSGCWVSRAKEPNLWRAKRIAETLGFTEEVREGERLTFAEQVENTQDKAEARAERMEARAEKAETRAKQLQKPINNMHGDIAFFTQPNISSSSGRAFTNQRNKMFASYERGFEEYSKSSYYKGRAAAARETASKEKYSDIAYCQRRIEETQKSIRAREKNLVTYEERLYKIEQGETLKRYDGTILTAEYVQSLLENELELVNALMDKEAFLQECISACGGIKYSKDNIKVGYIVDVQRWGKCEVVGTGTKNITYKILTGGAAGMGGKASYAEILEVLESQEKQEEAQPFKIGEQFKVSEYSFEEKKSIEATYTIIKATAKTVTLQNEQGETTRKTPRKVNLWREGEQWRLCVVENNSGYFYRACS